MTTDKNGHRAHISDNGDGAQLGLGSSKRSLYPEIPQFPSPGPRRQSDSLNLGNGKASRGFTGRRAVSDNYGHLSKVVDPHDVAEVSQLVAPTSSHVPAQPTSASITWHLRDIQVLLSESAGQFEEVINSEERRVQGFRADVRLHAHQVLARRFTRMHETAPLKGGILADEMGLGKTIQILTQIVDNPGTAADKAKGWARSTLHCPVAVMDRWEEEAHKVAPALSILRHYGSQRTTDPLVLTRHDMVITTYGTMASEWVEYENEPMGIRCALFKVSWLRVVLDEAHKIKNRETRCSKAVCQFKSKYSWAVTGTPIQNSVEDLYPLFRFLGIKPLGVWTEYKTKISDPVKKGASRHAMQDLRAAIQVTMLRRLKKTIINGKPILTLPEKFVKHIECEFSEEERKAYSEIAEDTNRKFHKFLEQGEIRGTLYFDVLVLILRQRQACNHISLANQSSVLHDAAAVDPAPHDDDDVMSIHDEVEYSLTEKLSNITISPSSSSHCPQCQTEFSKTNRLKNSSHCVDCEIAVALTEKGLANKGLQLPPSSAKIRKTLQLLQLISRRVIPDGEMPEKTIVFSLFTSYLNLLEPFLRHHDISFVRLDGTMRSTQRTAVIKTINQSMTTTVILISLTAGGIGLDLSCCNNVILSDSWWNPAVEDQAFDRVHRLGQEREVHLYKLTVPDTIEDRILLLQDKKRSLAATVLSGCRPLKKSQLSLEELIALFDDKGNNYY